MKQVLNISIALLGMLMSTSCNNDEPLIEASDGSTININFTTKAVDGDTDTKHWIANDKINVTPTTEGVYPISGITFLFADGDADALSWKNINDNEDNFFTTTKYPVSFDAYYPADGVTSMTSFSILEDQSAANGLHAADYMTAKSASVTRSVDKLDIALQHRLSRVAFSIASYDERFGTTLPTVTSPVVYSISDVSVAYNDKGEATVTASGPEQEIIPFTTTSSNNDGKHKYEAIVAPSALVSGTTKLISLTVNGRSFDVIYAGALSQLESGKTYNFNLNIGLNAVTVSSITISDMNTGTSINLENSLSIRKTANVKYEIYNAAGLKAFADIVNGAEYQYTIDGITIYPWKNSDAFDRTRIWGTLKADIDLSTVCGPTLGSWIPIGKGGIIGKNEIVYKGWFNGDGHSISGLYIDNEDEGGGLFGKITEAPALITNITLKGGYINSSSSPNGPLVKTIESIVYSNIENCHVVNGDDGKPFIIKGSGCTGGLIGEINGKKSYIRNCSSSATIVSKEDYAGGIIGRTNNSTSDSPLYMIACSFTGSVQSNNATGGLIGAVKEGIFNIVASNSTGTVNCVTKSGGGFVGARYHTLNMQSCYADSPVTGGEFLGWAIGLCGGEAGSSDMDVEGVDSMTFNYCFLNTNRQTTVQVPYGDFAGQSFALKFENSEYDATTPLNDRVDKLNEGIKAWNTGKTVTNELCPWHYEAGASYPVLVDGAPE